MFGIIFKSGQIQDNPVEYPLITNWLLFLFSRPLVINICTCTLRTLLDEQSILGEQGGTFLENQLSKQEGIFLEQC